MAMTLTQARTRCRNLIDGGTSQADDDRWLDSEIDTSLEVALEQVIDEAVSAGLTGLDVTESFTVNSDGYVDLASVSPLKILTIASLQGTNRILVPPARRRTMSSSAQGSVGYVLEITYVPKPTFPASDSDVFTYGGSFPNSAVLDQYICAIAASDLKVKEEVSQALERRKAELQKTVQSLTQIPGCYVLPWSSAFSRYNRSPYSWVLENGTRIRLVLDC